MRYNRPIHIGRTVSMALLALCLIGLRAATGAAAGADSAESGRKLVEAWCKNCHAIEPRTAGTMNAAPDFAAVANMPSTTELALKVFLRTSHPNMPNLVLTPEQTDDIVNYILSLKPNRT
jgi:mono/diheme cytochrome c family protein